MNSPLPQFPLPHHQLFTILELVSTAKVTHLLHHHLCSNFHKVPHKDIVMLCWSGHDVPQTIGQPASFGSFGLWHHHKSLFVPVHCSDSLLSVTSDQGCVCVCGSLGYGEPQWLSGVCFWPDWWKFSSCWLTKKQWAPTRRQRIRMHSSNLKP